VTVPVTASPAVAALRAAIAAALVGPLAEVVLFDAGDLAQAYTTWSITLPGAWDPDTEMLSSADAITVEMSESGAARSMMETTTISGVIYAGTGDKDLELHRANAGAVLTAVRDAVRSITDVDGSAAMARVTSQTWAQAVNEDGAGVVLAFDVAVMVLL
jgi:hypothetical protein